MLGNKNKAVLLTLLISILVLSLIASTYAFVRLSITNANNFSASLKSGNIEVIFSDGNPGFNAQISLGGSVEKLFTIENTGQGEAYATMSWRELQNTYTPGSLVYTLEESSDGGLTYTSKVSSIPVPTSNENLAIAENLAISTGTTMYYKLTISYIFQEEVNQTQDLHAYLTTLFTLEEGSFKDKAVLKEIGSNYWKANEWCSADYSEPSLVKTITFERGINIPNNAEVSWDISTAQNGSIMAYMIKRSDYYTYDTSVGPDNLVNYYYYDLHIATDRMQIYFGNNSGDLFKYLRNLEEINNFEILNFSNITDMSDMFYECDSLTSLDLSSFDTSNITNMSGMFSGCRRLTSLDLSSFDTSNVTDMSSMFSGLNLAILDISNFDTSNVKYMSGLFRSCKNVSSFDFSILDTSSVTSLNYMFSNCNVINLDLSNFNTSNVTSMSGMFERCSSLTSLDLSDFDTSNVTDMAYMFGYCTNLTSLDLSSFNTSNVTNMSYMFTWCNNLINLDLSNFDTSNVTDMGGMFMGCTNLNTIYISNTWVTSKVTVSYSMFYYCTNLVGGAGTTYNSSYDEASYAHVDGGPSNPGYLTLKV